MGPIEMMPVLLQCMQQLITYQERSASDLWERANMASETATLLKETLQPVMLALYSDRTRVVEVRDGDHIYYLHPDEPSQEIIGVEDVGKDPKKRAARDSGNGGYVSGDSDEVSESETGSTVSGFDDLPPLEPFEEGAPQAIPKFHTMMMYGDLQGPGEMRHLNSKKNYSTSNDYPSCHVCSHLHRAGERSS